MILVNNFKCMEVEAFGDGTKLETEGVKHIRQELVRPQKIRFKNSLGENIELDTLTSWSKQLNSYYFSRKELEFLSEKYNIKLIENVNYRDELVLTSTNKSKHELYDSSAKIKLFELNTKEYLMIYFKRWQSEVQPRGAGEDTLGEDITYIQGIWEDPLLTDEIITKIKSL